MLKLKRYYSGRKHSWQQVQNCQKLSKKTYHDQWKSAKNVQLSGKSFTYLVVATTQQRVKFCTSLLLKKKLVHIHIAALSIPIHLLDCPTALQTARNKCFLGCRGSIFFPFLPILLSPKKECPIFKGWLIKKKGSIVCFFGGSGLILMAPYALEEPFQALRIVIFTIFWEQLKRIWAWMFFGPIFINNVEFNCIK